MMAENKLPPSLPAGQGKKLEVAPEELTETGKIAKEGRIIYQEQGFQEPMFGDKAREFEKENNLLRMSAEQIARLFVDTINKEAGSVVVEDDIKSLLGKAKSAFDGWLAGHAYKVSKPEDIFGYLGAEVGKEIDNILKAEWEQGKVKASKIKEKNYWSQFKEQAGL
jgi:hypothetical protein